MKYSITAGEAKGQPLALGGSFSRVFSNYSSTYAFSLREGKVKLLHLGAEGEGKEGSGGSSAEFVCPGEVDWQRLKHIEQTGQEWILLLQNPFQIMFYLKKYQTLVPILFQQQLHLDQLACYVTYPQCLLYGYSHQLKANAMYTLNLHTFQLKAATNPKDYSPGSRTQFWSHFSDDRLYVMGGNCAKGQPDKLLWTYNTDNGYWFALEVNEALGCLLNCEFENGKVLAVGGEEIWVVELYQSRVAKVEGWREVVSAEELRGVTGVYVFKDEIYLVGEHKTVPLRIIKSKVNQ